MPRYNNKSDILLNLRTFYEGYKESYKKYKESNDYNKSCDGSNLSLAMKRKSFAYQSDKIDNALKFYASFFVNEYVQIPGNTLRLDLNSQDSNTTQIDMIKNFIIQFGQEESNLSAVSQEANRQFSQDMGYCVMAGLLFVGGVAAGIAFGIICSSPLGAIAIIIAGLLLAALTLYAFSVGSSFDNSRAISENILSPIRFFNESKYQGFKIEFLEIQLSTGLENGLVPSTL